jgi:hypothetical protein
MNSIVSYVRATAPFSAAAFNMAVVPAGRVRNAGERVALGKGGEERAAAAGAAPSAAACSLPSTALPRHKNAAAAQVSIFDDSVANAAAIYHNLLCDARCCPTAYASNSLLCNATHFSLPDPADPTKPKTWPVRRGDALRAMERRALTLTGARAYSC